METPDYWHIMPGEHVKKIVPLTEQSRPMIFTSLNNPDCGQLFITAAFTQSPFPMLLSSFSSYSPSPNLKGEMYVQEQEGIEHVKLDRVGWFIWTEDMS